MVQAKRAAKTKLSTRDKLKLTARRLFAERGIGGVTVRDILAASGEKNGASLNYYFGSKDELTREIVADLFQTMDARWAAALAELQRRTTPPGVRDYVRLLVEASDTSDVEEIPTCARLAEAFSHQHYDVVLSVLKHHRLVNYDKVLALLAACLPDIPAPILRQRLIFLTRYLSSVFALYEAASVGRSPRQRTALGLDYDLGNVVDTAVGLISADVVDAIPR